MDDILQSKVMKKWRNGFILSIIAGWIITWTTALSFLTYMLIPSNHNYALYCQLWFKVNLVRLTTTDMLFAAIEKTYLHLHLPIKHWMKENKLPLQQQDPYFNPLPILVTWRDIHGKMFPICQKDVIGWPAWLLTVHACSGEADIFRKWTCIAGLSCPQHSC